MEADNKGIYKKKSKRVETNISQDSSKVSEEPISFGFWFTIALRDGRVQFWQDKEIFVFFKNRGLTDKETRSKYDEMLKFY